MNRFAVLSLLFVDLLVLVPVLSAICALPAWPALLLQIDEPEVWWKVQDACRHSQICWTYINQQLAHEKAGEYRLQSNSQAPLWPCLLLAHFSQQELIMMG